MGFPETVLALAFFGFGFLMGALWCEDRNRKRKQEERYRRTDLGLGPDDN